MENQTKKASLSLVGHLIRLVRGLLGDARENLSYGPSLTLKIVCAAAEMDADEENTLCDVTEINWRLTPAGWFSSAVNVPQSEQEACVCL